MSDIKIGKNAIENLTIGMYEESKIIYREYIQNAADQIDRANKEKLFKEELYIDIKIDSVNRKIVIRDNATGIPKDLVRSKLEGVADSDKEKGKDKGFRGIGRLGGLAYCETLRFITSARGEKIKTIMEWNAKELIRMLDDPSIKDDAASVLNKIIKYSFEECEEEEHFFIVELENIREDNNDLLDISQVRRYIAINAPVPYPSKLIYKSKISEYLVENNLPNNEYKIFVNTQQVLKLYTTSLYEKSGTQKKKYDEIYDIQIEEFRTDEGELLAWMWYGVSAFTKRIPSSVNDMAGIRIRQANIQIGDENTLIRFFKEERGNFYFVGEIHAVHPQLIPNGRRDYFNENYIRNEFEARLKYYFDNFHRLYHDANDAKAAYKKELELRVKQEEFEKKNGVFLNDKERDRMEEEIKTAKKEQEKANKKIERLKEKAKTDPVLQRVLKQVEENHENSLEEIGLSNDGNKKHTKGTNEKSIENNQHRNKKRKSMYLVDELSKLNDKQRKLVSKIYGIISNNLPDKESMALINKIQEELKR